MVGAPYPSAITTCTPRCAKCRWYSPARGASVTRMDSAAVEAYYVASQRQLIWRRFRRHKVAVASLILLTLMDLSAILADFIAPYPANERQHEYRYAPTQRLRFFHPGYVGPHMYGLERDIMPFRAVSGSGSGSRGRWLRIHR